MYRNDRLHGSLQEYEDVRTDLGISGSTFVRPTLTKNNYHVEKRVEQREIPTYIGEIPILIGKNN